VERAIRIAWQQPEVAHVDETGLRVAGISTLRKQGYSVLDGLSSVFARRPDMPRLETWAVTNSSNIP
jgi:hypothetical protein